MKTRVPEPANDRGLHPARALARMIFAAKMRGHDSQHQGSPHGQLRHLRSVFERPAE